MIDPASIDAIAEALFALLGDSASVYARLRLEELRVLKDVSAETVWIAILGQLMTLAGAAKQRTVN